MRSEKAKVVSFSGIDGAGKSTQIEALQHHLRAHGLRSVLYTFWDDVVVLPRFREHMSLTAFKGDKGVGSPDKPINRRDKNVSSWYVIAARLFLYLLDAFNLRLTVSRSSNTGADFVIFDRYIYDEMANLPLHRWPARIYVRLLLKLVSKPEIAFLVDADPVAAHTRKPEYPLDFVCKNRDAYLALSRLCGMTVLAPLTVDETTGKIKELISQKCPEPDSSSSDLALQCVAARTAKSSHS